MQFLPVLRGERAALGPADEKALNVAFSRYYSDLAVSSGLHHRARDWPIERAVTEGYDRVIWVFKSVNTIGADSARLPFQLWQGDDLVEDHPLYNVLNKKANPLETGQVFRKRLSAQILLSKRGAFVQVVKSNGGSVKRLDLLPPDRVEIVPGSGTDDDSLVDHYRLTRVDGTIKNLGPEEVRWFRDPHPIDPYMGVTPLESAGLSVELDHFARLYNVAFMQNDGRPGGILAVRKTDGASGDISQRSMDRLEARFGKGPVEAGKLSVIAGELDYVDMAARPRDMQYGATSRNAKIEILSGFGVPESVLGYSAERTYDNADAELYTYWTRTLPAHHEIILTGLDEDSDDDLTGRFDTSDVEVLERAARAEREEARTEVDKGLRSIKSYADLAGYGDEIDDTPHTRALYIGSSKTPLPSREEDAEALGLAVPTDDPAAAAPGADGAAPPEVAAAPSEAPAALGAAPGAPTPPTAPAAPTTGAPAAPGAAAAALAAVAGKSFPLKALPAGGGPAPKVVIRLLHKGAPAHTVTDPDLPAADRLEDALAAAMDALAVRWTERAVARLTSPKQRKHTRHWAPEYALDTRVGTKALDTARAVDEQTWQAEAEEAARPLVTAAATAAALAVFADLGLTPPPGVDAARLAAQAVAGTITSVVAMIGRSAATQARKIIADVNRADQDGATLAAITSRVRDAAATMGGWARGVSTQAATATSNGARDDAAREVNRDDGVQIDRVWFSRRDNAVRHTHAQGTGADGQVRGLDEPFIVGDALLRRPGDPLGPLRETAGCRCYLRHRARRTGRWMSGPTTKDIASEGPASKALHAAQDTGSG